MVRLQSRDRWRVDRVWLFYQSLQFHNDLFFTSSLFFAVPVFSAVKCSIVALLILTVVDFDGCTNHFLLLELSVVKVILDPVF